MKKINTIKKIQTVKRFAAILILALMTYLPTVHAQSLIYDDSCVTDGVNKGTPLNSRYNSFDSSDKIISYIDSNFYNEYSEYEMYPTASGRTSLGFRCDNIKNYRYGLEVMKVTTLPAMMALKSPAVQAQLIELGLTAANPAVLGITVLGASGYVVIYLILTKTIEECEAMDQEIYKQSIIKEMETKFGLRVPKNISVK